MNQTASISFPCLFSGSTFYQGCLFISEATIRVHTILYPDAFLLMFSSCRFIKTYHSCGNLGMWFHQESRGKSPSLIPGEQPTSPVEGFSIPQISVICTYAIFEPGFQTVVTLSLICGTCHPMETDRIQRMAFEKNFSELFPMSFGVFTEVY